MQNLLNKLSKQFPGIQFAQSESFYWSPQTKTVHYRELAKDEQPWPLFHELGHAIREHQNFSSDFELLLLEIAAWDEAKKIAQSHNIHIDEDHIQDCLDTYRDWIYKRSTCPACMSNGLQITAGSYSCVFCYNEWHVSKSRKCRIYRKTQRAPAVGAL